MLSLFWQITPHFEGIGAIKMVLGTFLKLRIVGKPMSWAFPPMGVFERINGLVHRANLHPASQRNFSLAKISGIY